MTAYGFGIFGMWGPVTDPGESQFSQRVRDEVGIDIQASPYRDYDVNTIVASICALPPEAKVLIWGSSLGANNAPVVASYVYSQQPSRVINGIWGFQASLYGAQVPITRNVLFAHEAYNPAPIETFGLGAYRWTKADGNAITNVYYTTNNDLHPGDGDENVQNMFLAEMKRVVA